jgi:hypothetical protein
LGFPIGWSSTRHQAYFLGPLRETKKNNLPHQLGTSLFSSTVAGEEVEDFCGGSFSHTHHLFCYCFALLILPASFYQKPKKIRILGCCYFFTLVYYI